MVAVHGYSPCQGMCHQPGQGDLSDRLPAPRCTFCPACLNAPADQRAEEREQSGHHHQGYGGRLAAADVVIIGAVEIGKEPSGRRMYMSPASLG